MGSGSHGHRRDECEHAKHEGAAARGLRGRAQRRGERVLRPRGGGARLCEAACGCDEAEHGKREAEEDREARGEPRHHSEAVALRVVEHDVGGGGVAWLG